MTRKLCTALFFAMVLAAALSAASIAASKATSDVELLETLTVPSDGSSVTSTTVLASGVTYQLRAGGTIRIGCGDVSGGDAEYADCPGLATPEDNCNQSPSDTDIGIALNDSDVTKAGRKQPFWGPFDSSHVYTIDFTGQDAAISLNYHDCNTTDNFGTLRVEIYGPPPGKGSTDSTPPAVSIALDSPGGSTPDGFQDWFRFGPVDVTITADDSSTGDSEVTAIDCGSAALTTSGLGSAKALGTLTVVSDGILHLSCTATDAAGNSSAPATADVKLDTTSPLVLRTPADDTCTGPMSNGWCRAFSGKAAYTLSDATSGGSSPLPGVCAPGSTCPFTVAVVGNGLIRAPFLAACDVAGNCTCNLDYFPGADLFCKESRDDYAPLKLDSVPPTVQRDAQLDSCSIPGDNGWCRGIQAAGFTASDAISGVGTPCASPLFGSCDFTKSASAEGSAVTTDSGQVCDVAGNCVAGAPAGPFKVDRTPPTLAPTLPATVLLHGSAHAAPNATDALSGVAAQSCEAVDTSSAGVHTLICTARDNAGNAATATLRYLVEYRIVGFIALPPGSKVGGKLLQLRARLEDAKGNAVSNSEALGLLRPSRVTFDGTGAQTAHAGMTYNTNSKEFQYVWRLGPKTGGETIAVTVTYPGTSDTTVLSEPITITF